MPNLRDRSSLRKTKLFEVSVNHKYFLKWSRQDKQTMIKAIKKGKTSTDELVRYFPHKSREEVQAFLEDKMEKARALVSSNKIESLKENKAPENPWVRFCDKMLEDVPDYTYNFDKILRGFSEEIKSSMEYKRHQPNWAAVYDYITSLFDGRTQGELKQLEAGAVLMLLEDLLSSYQNSETSEQKALCKTKYMFLSGLGDDQTTNEQLMQAAADLDILKSSVQIPVGSTTSSPAPKASVGPPTSTTGQIYGHVVNLPSQKPKRLETMYSINPLCVPIRLINPKPKRKLEPST